MGIKVGDTVRAALPVWQEFNRGDSGDDRPTCKVTGLETEDDGTVVVAYAGSLLTRGEGGHTNRMDSPQVELVESAESPTIPNTSEVMVTDPNTGGQKGSKDERFGLMPVRSLEECARVFGYGAKKYAMRNWEQGYDWELSYSAAQRHLHAFWRGEDMDPESGIHHLAHATFHMLALMEFGHIYPEGDTRAKG